MKLRTENKRLSFMILFLATAISLNSHAVKAQDDLLDDTDELLGDDDALQMDAISIEGKLSPSELLKRRREKLEERNKIMVEKKIEDIRVKQEIALTNKLQGAFNTGLNNINEDKVQTVQAAPVAPAPAPVSPAPVVETRIIEVQAPAPVAKKASKIIPFIGTSSVKSDRIDLGSNVGLGVGLETNILPQVSVGFGIGYTTFDITDVANDFVPTSSGGFNDPGYQNVYGAGRKMSNKKLTIEAGGKFFFTEDSKLNPFIGGALSYNRSTLKYENTSPYASNNINYGGEGYSSTAMAATARLGAEIDVNETVGVNLDLSYTKNITSGISQSAKTVSTNPDQARLENVTKAIEEGDTTAIQAGVIIRF